MPKRKSPPPGPVVVVPPPPYRRRLEIIDLPQGAAAPTTTPTPGKWQLPRVPIAFIALYFIVLVEGKCNRRIRRVVRKENNISQIKVLQAFDSALQKHLNPIHRSLESLTERIHTLTHEVGQIKQSNPNHHANEHYRSEANQDAAGFAQYGEVAELRFLNKLKPRLYTQEKIRAADGTAIQIALYKDNQIVQSGPLSSARIELLALEGDFNDDAPQNWTECMFSQNIARFRKGPVLGVCQIKLKNGEASPSDISFVVPSSKSRSGMFILAARVHSSDKAGFRIMEALMDPVVVQVYRNKANKNSDSPKLKDEVYRLKGISKTGTRFEWLKHNGIKTVEDMLKALNKNEKKIRTECFKLKKNSEDWKETVEHARKCDLEGNCNLKSYRVEEQHVVLFFNCVHDLVGAQFHDGYVTKDNFDSDQQDAVNCLKKQAYDALDDIAFDDKMKDNYPVSLSSAMNTSITDGDASIPLTDRAGTNPPDLHATSQAVGNSHHAEIYQAPELPEAFLNYNSACEVEPSVEELVPTEEYCLYDQQDEGYRVGAMTQIFGGFSEADIPIGFYIGQACEATSSGGNALIGLTNVSQNVSDDSNIAELNDSDMNPYQYII
uniref:Calmodulin-binding protein-like n=1 Tax=Oryza punctata TaxID=4537 RepID=A0A0E0MI03_ORYPU